MVEFYRLAETIPTAHPIFGVQARGIDGRDEPFDRVEDMAAYYMDTLATLHPSGPYLLVGYSFGGLVALEMAQQMLARKQRVDLLVLIDAYPHPRFMPAAQRWRLALRRMHRHAGNMAEIPLGQAVTYFWRGIQRKFFVSGPEVKGLAPAGPPLSFATTLPYVNQKAYTAYANYRPRFYPGPIKFITTEEKTFFPGDPAIIWNQLTSDFESVTIPGNHLNIVHVDCTPLADVLTGFLRSAT
jgi:thioesterase domain-containing protein